MGQALSETFLYKCNDNTDIAVYCYHQTLPASANKGTEAEHLLIFAEVSKQTTEISAR